MKVAIVHDYIKEFGGAERVLETLSEIYPDAPIYTAFFDKSSNVYEHFKDKKIISSWFNYVPFASKLVSPLRFLTPLIWSGFNFKNYDVVISSASWFITKGFKKRGDSFVEICYCHTPPRWLYGYQASVKFRKHALVRMYAYFVGHFLRLYDYNRAQKVDYFIANSKEVQNRIHKFYRKDSIVIYPPVNLQASASNKQQTKDYYFIVSRIVGAKGLELAVEAAVKAGFKLKIAGTPSGYFEFDELVKKSKGKVEFLGHVSDAELSDLYGGAKAFLALSRDEDFGLTPVEAQSFGTPVIAFNGGGYVETIIDGKTGILFDDYSKEGLINAIKKFENIKFNSYDCIVQANKFSKDRFIKKIKDFVLSSVKASELKMQL